MKRIKYIIICLALFFLTFVLSSCHETVAYRHRNRNVGPPDHAPAHGVRKKQADTVVVVEVEK